MVVGERQRIQIYLLGKFEVRRGEQVVRAADWSRRKAAALMQRVALEKRLLRDQALEFLWPESDPVAAANNLYRTLYSYRQTIDEELGEDTANAIISFNDGVLRLGPDVWVDVHHFETLGQQTNASKTAIEEALSLYHGPLLPDSLYDDWTAPHRQTLSRLHRDLCLRLVRKTMASNEIETMVARLQPLLEDDPADEDVHRELMRLYALAGRRHEALRQYRACVEALASELGVKPTPETEALHEQILSGELKEVATSQALDAHWSPAPQTAKVQAPDSFVGRDRERNMLNDILREAAQGKGNTVLIRGVTGVGKTRLAYEALQAAAARGMVILSGAAYEFEGRLAYQPFIEAIDRYLVEQGRGSVENPMTHFTPQNHGDPQQEKWALFSETASFFAKLGAGTPVVFFLDDLHAADGASLQLFHYLARHTRMRPFVLLATYRTDIVSEPVSPFNSLLNALYREKLREQIDLQPLSSGEIAHMVRDIYGGEMDPGSIETIFAASEGNPFYAEELCRTLLRSEQVVKDGDVWHLKPEIGLGVPSDLRELLRERIAQGGGAVVSALETAAIIGQTFSFEILRQISILAESELIDALDGALNAGFIEEMGNGYRFRHGMVRRALYQAQSQRRRARLHSLVAAAFENAYATRGEGLAPHVELLAHHYERSDRRERALQYLTQAGQRAADVYAFEGAVDYYERALSLMDELALEDQAQRWDILEALGWWGKLLADTPQAVAWFEQALSLKSSGTWQAQPNDRARVHAGAAMALLTVGDTTAAEEHLKAALAEVDEQKYASEYADILYNVSQVHWHRNEFQQSFDVAQRSLDIAEKLNDPIAIARAFEMLALACHSLGEWQLGLGFEKKRSAIAGPEIDVTDAFDVHL